MRNNRRRLLDILEAIELIEKYAQRGRQAFEEDELIQTWVLHHLQIIGEAVRQLSPEFRKANPEIKWSEIIGMRNILVHHYFGIDTEIVWTVVERDVPSLKRNIQQILKTFEPVDSNRQ
ncbi:MAG: DUF86 domain-containing protein [Candidatus Heimdallarchaeota archaeon]